MKERPILFSAPMVRALLAGTKTQTRRVVKPQPLGNFLSLLERPLRAEADEPRLRAWFSAGDGENTSQEITCPYGMPGDRLWVRETWRKACAHEDDDTLCIAYRASQEEGRGGLIVNNIPRPAGVERWETEDAVWRPSIHMPRWASRVTLEVTDVRVERLQNISGEDCIAEGASGGHGAIPGYGYAATPFEHYWHIWETINGAGSWAANPWVWVVEFKRLEEI